MFHKKTHHPPIPVIISIFKVIHALLVLNAVAIVGITVFPGVSASSYACAIITAIPIFAGSCIFLLTTTAYVFFAAGIFFCALLTFLLACLPLMMNVFFPIHLVVWALAAVYGISCVILARSFFSQPVRKNR